MDAEFLRRIVTSELLLVSCFNTKEVRIEIDRKKKPRRKTTKDRKTT